MSQGLGIGRPQHGTALVELVEPLRQVEQVVADLLIHTNIHTYINVKVVGIQ